MLDAGDNAFIYSACREAKKKSIKGTEDFSLEELNFSKEDIAKADEFDKLKTI